MALPAAILAGGAAIAGAIGQAKANRTNRDIAREQMRFQERMSSTAWQRGVQDMRAAGLNPALAYQQGGASSPSGAGTRVDSVVGQAANNARTAALMKQEVRRASAEADLAATNARAAQHQNVLLGLDGFLSKDANGNLVISPRGMSPTGPWMTRYQSETGLVGANARRASNAADITSPLASMSATGSSVLRPILEKSAEGWNYLLPANWKRR